MRLLIETTEILPGMPFRCLFLFLAMSLFALGADSIPKARVAIFMGLPGDAGRATNYLATVEKLHEALTKRYGIPSKDIVILFGKKGDSSYKECSGRNVVRELDRLHYASRDRRPVWIFVLGHAESVKNDVFFNLPGTDLSAREFGVRLRRLPASAKTIVFLTGAASGNCLAYLGNPNQCVVAATAPGAEDNETDFPHALADVLAQGGESDTNRDGRFSVPEIVKAVRDRVKAGYREKGCIPTEQAVYDADGDGTPGKTGSGEEQRAARFHLPISP